MTDRATVKEMLARLIERAETIEAGLAGLAGHFESRFARLEEKFEAVAEALNLSDTRRH